MSREQRIERLLRAFSEPDRYRLHRLIEDGPKVWQQVTGERPSGHKLDRLNRHGNARGVRLHCEGVDGRSRFVTVVAIVEYLVDTAIAREIRSGTPASVPPAVGSGVNGSDLKRRAAAALASLPNDKKAVPVRKRKRGKGSCQARKPGEIDAAR